MRRLLIVIPLALMACAPADPAPLAPMTIHVATTQADVVQRAARYLVLAGFSIGVADQGAGVLRADIARTPAQFGADVACGAQPGSPIVQDGLLSIGLSLSARTAPGGGTDVAVSTSPRLVLNRGPLHMDSASKCASTGEIEKRLAAALSAT